MENILSQLVTGISCQILAKGEFSLKQKMDDYNEGPVMLWACSFFKKPDVTSEVRFEIL